MIVLICGGRDYNDWDTFQREIDNINGITEIISGGAKGADRMAGQYAISEGIERRIFRAKWNQLGNMAGYVRNRQMLVEGKPDLVVAFPGGKGTAMMIKLAKEAGVPVIEISGL